jgi:hypothetical protein
MVQVIYPPYYNMPCIKHQTASVSTPCSVVFHMIGKNSLSLPTSTRSACIRLSLHALPLLVPRTLPNMAWAVFGSTLHTTHLHPHVCGAHRSPSISSNAFLPMPIPMDNSLIATWNCQRSSVVPPWLLNGPQLHSTPSSQGTIPQPYPG